MCVRPISLRNKYNYFRTFQTRLGEVTLTPSGRYKLLVPCGHCWQCLQSKCDSWVFRCQSEFAYCKEKALFLTLTYDEAHLPLHPYKSSPDAFPVMVSVWDKPACQSYLKSLNEKVIYRIGVSLGLTRLCKGRITPEWREFLDAVPSRFFSYILTCERGSFDSYVSDSGHHRFGTGRPHYHCILFVRPDVFTFRGSSYSFTDFFTLDDLQSFCVNSWKYGSCYPLVVKGSRLMSDYDRSSLGAIRYVCKYISKDCSFDYKNVKMSNLVWTSHREKLNRLPFTLFSNFLGLDWFYSSDFRDNYLKYLSDGVTVYAGHGKTRQINVPLYYLNRLRFIVTPVEQFTVTFPVKTEAGSPYTDHVQQYSTYSEVRKVLQVVNVPTIYNDEISRDILHRKAEHYCNLLSAVQKLPPLYFQNLFSDDDALYGRYLFLKSRLCSASSDDFYQFIVEDLYTSDFSDLVGDAYTKASFFTSLFEFLVDYKSLVNNIEHERKQLTFKGSLTASQLSKPNLFNVSPLTNSL